MKSAREGLTDRLNEEIMCFVRTLKVFTNSAAVPDKSSLHLLWPLLDEGPMRLRALAEAKQADPSTVSRQAAQLVRAGLVDRAPDPADARACLFVLTEQGRAVWDTLKQQRRDAIADALAAWSDDDLSTFADLFSRFNHAFQRQHPSRELMTSPTATPTGAVPTQENA